MERLWAEPQALYRHEHSHCEYEGMNCYETEDNEDSKNFDNISFRL